MTVSGFLTGQAGAGRSLSAGPSTDFGDVFGAGLTNAWVNTPVGGALQYVGAPLNERNDLLKQRTGQDVYDLTGVRKKYPNPTSEGFLQMSKEANAAIDDVILQGRAKFPEKYNGIKTTKEIKENARTVAGLNERHFAEMMIRNPSAISRAVGGFTGSMVGTMLDPPNLATLPLGAGEIQAGLKGFQMARAVMKAAVVDGTVNAAIEAAQQPAMMEWQKTLGHKYGFGEAVENVGFAFVGGAGLSAMIRGTAHGIKRGADYLGSVSADVLDKIAMNEKLPPMVRDAASFMSRQAHIDESAPPGSVKTQADMKVHRDTTQRVADDFENYKTQTSVLYHQTSKEAAKSIREGGFRTDIIGARKTEDTFPDAVFLKPDQTDIGVGGKGSSAEQVRVRANLGNVLEVEDRQALEKFLRKDPEYNKLVDISRKADKDVSAEYDRLEKSSDDIYKKLIASGMPKKEAAVHPEFMEEFNKLMALDLDTPVSSAAQAARKRSTEYLKSLGYDAVRVKKDAGSFGRSTETIAVLDPSRVNADELLDFIPPERFGDTLAKLPEGMAPEVSADRVARAESDLKGLVEELGDEKIALDDGRTVSLKEFAEEVNGKKALIEAMKTCRIA